MKYQVVRIHDPINVNFGRYYWKDENGALLDSVRYLSAPFSYPEGTILEAIPPRPVEAHNRPSPETWDRPQLTRAPNGDIVRKKT